MKALAIIAALVLWPVCGWATEQAVASAPGYSDPAAWGPQTLTLDVTRTQLLDMAAAGEAPPSWKIYLDRLDVQAKLASGDSAAVAIGDLPPRQGGIPPLVDGPVRVPAQDLRTRIAVGVVRPHLISDAFLAWLRPAGPASPQAP